MPYPRRFLNEGESVAVDLKPHWWFFASQIIWGLVVTASLLFLVIVLDGTLQGIVWWVWALGALVWAGFVVKKYTDWQFTYFVVTNRRVIFRTGMVAKHGVEVPLGRISNINFKQGVWERIIGAGDLMVESAGSDGQSTFDNVRHPDAVQQEIYRQMEGQAQVQAAWTPPPAPAAAPGAPAGPSPAEQLHQLAELRDKGVITPEEFEAKKAELLGRM